jgi:hypothetical protein
MEEYYSQLREEGKKHLGKEDRCTILFLGGFIWMMLPIWPM